MESEIFSYLFDAGAMGIFAGFLIWQHLGMQKRMDSLVESFQTQLRDIQVRGDEQEEKLRDRYDIVIAKYDVEREKLMSDVVGKLDQALSKLDTGLREINNSTRAPE